MKNKYFLILLFLFSFISAYSQSTADSTKKKKFTPYELLSSYYNNNFNPFKRKTIYLGFSMSLADNQLENVDNFFQKVIDGKKVDFSVLVKSGYYINDYNMIGLNLNYFENKFDGIIFRDPDSLQSNTITRGFSFTPNFRTTIPVTKNERLNFFTTVGLTLGKSSTLKRDVRYLDEIEKSFAENYNLRLGLSPGVTFFAMENFALEIQLDVLGYELNADKKNVNGIEQSKQVKNNINFKINLLTTKFGLAYYFNNKKNKKK